MVQSEGHIDPGRLERSLRQLDVKREDRPLEAALEQVLDAARVLFRVTRYRPDGDR